MDSSFLNLPKLIEGFRISCQIEGKSRKTVVWHSAFLERFRVFLEQNGLPTDINRLDKTHIRQFAILRKRYGVDSKILYHASRMGTGFFFRVHV